MTSQSTNIKPTFNKGDSVFVIDWGKQYTDFGKVVFEWKAEVPRFSGPDNHWKYEYEPNLTLKGTPNKREPTKLKSKTPIYKNFKYEVLEVRYHPNAGEFTQTEEFRKDNPDYDDRYPTSPICLIASINEIDTGDRCYVEIGEEGLSKLTPEQFKDASFDALVESHKGKYDINDRVNGKVEGFPKELIKKVYDVNDRVLFGSSYTKGKVAYEYVDGIYTKDGVPFIICVSILYDGVGNYDLPTGSTKVSFNDLPKMFPNNEFA